LRNSNGCFSGLGIPATSFGNTEGIGVVFSQMVGHARNACMDFGAAQFSGVTSSPVAAFTNGGPPIKMVPWLRTMIVSSHMAGT
jgi:hypothetical protein